MGLLLISLVVGIIQYQRYVRKQYAHNYVVALYGIKSGMNLTGLISGRQLLPYGQIVGKEVKSDSQFGELCER